MVSPHRAANPTGQQFGRFHVCPGKRLRVRSSLVHVYIHMRSSSGLFRVHTDAKRVNQFPAGKRKFTPPSFGKECKRQCREDAAVKL